MVDTDLIIDAKIDAQYLKLNLIKDVFDFDVTDDYEFAIAVLLEYATEKHQDGKTALDAVEEIKETIEET